MKTRRRPTCDKCGSTNMAEQPGGIFPGLLVCQEPDCGGTYLTDGGAKMFRKSLNEMWLKKQLENAGNNKLTGHE